MRQSVTIRVLLGAGAGYVASKLMDRVTTAYQKRQSEGSKQREKELLEVPAYVKAAEKLAEVGGTQIDQRRAEEVGEGLHRGLGVAGGLVAELVVARGANPIGAGILTALGMWLFIDEGGNAVLGLTPPPTAYPWETHARGLVGHLAYGSALGIMLTLGNLRFPNGGSSWRRSP